MKTLKHTPLHPYTPTPFFPTSTPLLPFHFPSTASTNDAARRLALEHPGRELLVTAETQTAGRGRNGRTWRSPVGGAWFSVVIPVEQPRPTAPLTVGLAVRRVVAALVGDDDVKIKWPNDVLLGGRKIAGVLCEQVLPVAPGGDPLAGVTLILGVGINVNNRVEALADLCHPATSLIEALGTSCDVNRLIRHTAQTIAQYIACPFVADDVRRHLAWLGEPVCVTLRDRETRGVLEGIDVDGRLRLGTDAGTVTFDTGEVGRVRRITEHGLAGAVRPRGFGGELGGVRADARR